MVQTKTCLLNLEENQWALWDKRHQPTELEILQRSHRLIYQVQIPQVRAEAHWEEIHCQHREDPTDSVILKVKLHLIKFTFRRKINLWDPSLKTKLVKLKILILSMQRFKKNWKFRRLREKLNSKTCLKNIEFWILF